MGNQRPHRGSPASRGELCAERHPHRPGQHRAAAATAIVAQTPRRRRRTPRRGAVATRLPSPPSPPASGSGQPPRRAPSRAARATSATAERPAWHSSRAAHWRWAPRAAKSFATAALTGRGPRGSAATRLGRRSRRGLRGAAATARGGVRRGRRARRTGVSIRGCGRRGRQSGGSGTHRVVRLGRTPLPHLWTCRRMLRPSRGLAPYAAWRMVLCLAMRVQCGQRRRGYAAGTLPSRQGSALSFSKEDMLRVFFVNGAHGSGHCAPARSTQTGDTTPGRVARACWTVCRRRLGWERFSAQTRHRQLCRDTLLPCALRFQAGCCAVAPLPVPRRPHGAARRAPASPPAPRRACRAAVGRRSRSGPAASIRRAPLDPPRAGEPIGPTPRGRRWRRPAGARPPPRARAGSHAPPPRPRVGGV